MNENFGNFLPGDLTFESEVIRREIGERIKKFFFGNETITESNSLQFLNYYSDTKFVYSILRNIKLQVEAGHEHIYLYEYSFHLEDSDVEGAIHCAQTAAVRDQDDHTLTNDYRQIKSFMRDVWYNFIKTGSPVVSGLSMTSWPPVNKINSSLHLSVGRETQLRSALLEDRTNFWDSIYAQYYKIPVPPTNKSN